jgi:hypothetical protein
VTAPSLRDLLADTGVEDLDAMDPLGGVVDRDPDEEIDGTKVERLRRPRLYEIRHRQSIAERNGWRR